MKIRNTYEKLYDHYNFISSKAITEKQKKQFKKYLVYYSNIYNIISLLATTYETYYPRIY